MTFLPRDNHAAQVAEDIFQWFERHPDKVRESAIGRDVLRDLAQLPVTQLPDDHPQFLRLFR